MLLILVLFLPFLIALGLLLRRWRGICLTLAPWAALPALLLAVFGAGASLELPWLLLGVRLQVDVIGQGFLLFSALLWWLAGLYARGYFSDAAECRRFFQFYLMAMTGNLGLILSQDMFSFLSFYALMSFSAYGLVIHRGDKEVRQAGLVYLTLVVVGEVLLFSGLLFHGGGEESGSMLVFLLFLGFGIKAGALPLHVWLPLAHPAAPTPASAVLSGAMIKAGLLGWIRFLPLGQIALPDWGTGIMVLGLVAALGAALVGLTQRDPKVLLAYSSISQMGLMTVMVGLGLAVPAAWSAVLPMISFYALHHGLAKGTLFLGVGLAERALGSRGRIGLWLGMTAAALVMAGLPLTSGAVAKAGLKELLTTWQQGVAMGMVSWVAVSTIATTALMLRLLWIVSRLDKGHMSVNVWLWLPSLLLLACSLLAAEAGKVGLNVSYPMVLTWSSWWPLLVGVMVAGIMYVSAAAHVSLRPLPAGDVLVVYRLLLGMVQRAWQALIVRIEYAFRKLVMWLLRRHENLNSVLTQLGQVESAISRWSVASLLMSVVLLAVALLMLL